MRHEGHVTVYDHVWRAETHLLTEAKEEVTLPNSKIGQSKLKVDSLSRYAAVYQRNTFNRRMTYMSLLVSARQNSEEEALNTTILPTTY
jgi:phage gp16-like protein